MKNQVWNCTGGSIKLFKSLIGDKGSFKKNKNDLGLKLEVLLKNKKLDNIGK